MLIDAMTDAAPPRSGPAETAPRPPVPLDRHPEVQKTLERAGLGSLLPAGLTSPTGRNVSWLGDTTTGHAVFVKKLLGPRRSVEVRMARLATLHEHLERSSVDAIVTPRQLAADPAAGVLVDERVGAGRSLAVELLRGSGRLDSAYAVGRAAGQLHASQPVRGLAYDRSIPDLPCVDDFDHLPFERFHQSTWGQLEAARLHQNDGPVADAVRQLHREETAAVKVPSHCDFRLDQVLVSDDETWILDWEEFRLADPARDVGSLTGEWIHRAIMNIVETEAGTPHIDMVFDHETVLGLGVQRLTELRPHVNAFWQGYMEESPHATVETAVRATRFVGWHMQDRLMAEAQMRATLPAISRAAAGIGRMLLLRAADFAAVIGLEGGRGV